MNPEQRQNKIRYYAYNWYKIRQHLGIKGTPEGDWLRGEEIVSSEYPERRMKQETIYFEDRRNG